MSEYQNEKASKDDQGEHFDQHFGMLKKKDDLQF